MNRKALEDPHHDATSRADWLTRLADMLRCDPDSADPFSEVFLEGIRSALSQLADRSRARPNMSEAVRRAFTEVAPGPAMICKAAGPNAHSAVFRLGATVVARAFLLGLGLDRDAKFDRSAVTWERVPDLQESLGFLDWEELNGIDARLDWEYQRALEAARSANSANNPKLFPEGPPDDPVLRDLALAIEADRATGKPWIQTAREYTEENGGNPDSLTSQLRRLRHDGLVLFWWSKRGR